MKADFWEIHRNHLEMALFKGFRQKSPFFQNRESRLERSYLSQKIKALRYSKG